jgi:hypothetical protein
MQGRAQRVRKNLKQGMALAWAASPISLIRYSVLGMVSAAMPPISVYLGATLVNRIAQARLQSLHFTDLLPIVIGLWLATTVRALERVTGYGRNLSSGGWNGSGAAPADEGFEGRSGTSIIPTGTIWLGQARCFVEPGDLTWSVLGLSGNIVTIVLMAGLLASLHWVLVAGSGGGGIVAGAGAQDDVAPVRIFLQRNPRNASEGIWGIFWCSRARQRDPGVRAGRLLAGTPSQSVGT